MTAKENTSNKASHIGIPARTTNPAKNIEVIPIIDVIDISICPIKITKNSPIAIIEINEACRKILRILDAVLNFGELIQQTTKRKIKRNKIIHSLKNDLNPPEYFLLFTSKLFIFLYS